MIAEDARMIQQTLNKMIVGSVLTVDDQIKAALLMMAKMYNHHHW